MEPPAEAAMGNLCCGGDVKVEELEVEEQEAPQHATPKRPGAGAGAAAAEAAAPSRASRAAADVGTAAASEQAEYEAELRALAATPALDEERLHELVGIVDVRETLHGFIKHGRQSLDTLVASIEARGPGTAKAAHALKGAAKTVGAARLAACAEAIERAAKQEERDGGNGSAGGGCARYIPSLCAALDDLAGEICQRQWQ